jgi:hypothetical protein
MTLFRPLGYVPVQEAIVRPALLWFPEDMAALEAAAGDELAINNRSNADIDAVTPVEKLARALRAQPLISEGLRMRTVDFLIQTEHRLRNILHKGVLTAYYFGGLFDQGRQAVSSEFWATMEADGVLTSGTYYPFGKPRSWSDTPRSYPLFFLELELAALPSDDLKAPSPSANASNELRGGVDKSRDESRRAAPKSVSAPGAKTRGVLEAINELWPDGIPEGSARRNATTRSSCGFAPRDTPSHQIRSAPSKEC